MKPSKPVSSFFMFTSLSWFFVFCVFADTPPYSDKWWEPVLDKNPPAWEVLPQAAKKNVEVILSKRNELGVFSNFTETPFEFHGKKYRSIEGFWQMMFYPEDKNDPRLGFKNIKWPHTRDEVSQMTSFQAKTAGDVGFENMKKMGIDWVTFEGKHLVYWTKDKGDHFQLIREVMKAKLKQNSKIESLLLATGTLILPPDHHQPEDAPPSWRYFDIWMDLRSELQKKSGK